MSRAEARVGIPILVRCILDSIKKSFHLNVVIIVLNGIVALSPFQ